MWPVVDDEVARVRRPGSSRSLLALTAAVSIAVAGCASTPTPSGPAASSRSNLPVDASGAPVPSGPLATLAPDPLGLLSADLFTGPPNPLTLQVTTAKTGAVAKPIGPDGGSIEAKGADGTVYTLTIPPKALPMPMTIGMTPVEAVSGYPSDIAPAHHLGVVFAPDGLPLAETATLTIHPAAPIDGAAMVVDFEGSGTDAGLHVFDRNGSDLTVPIDHFSGYIAEFPIKVSTIQTFAQWRQAVLEHELESNIASILSIERQRQLGMLNVDPADDLLTLAASALKFFKDHVLARKLAAASQGCAQSEDAMAAFGAYERQREIMVGDNPAFNLEGVKFIVPPTLVDLATRLCFREAYARCASTGDFPGMVVYIYGIFVRNENMLGVVPTDVQLALAHSFIERCGRWRVKVDLSGVTPDHIIGYTQTEETSREIDVQWKAGTGLYGIVGATIKGEAEIDVTKLEHVDEICGRGKITNVQTQKLATAEIVDLVFDRYEAIDPVPSKLTLRVDLGLLAYDLKSCPLLTEPPHHNTANFGYAAELVNGSGDLLGMLAGKTVTLDLADRWEFSRAPFKATARPWSGTFKSVLGGDRTTAKLDVSVEHRPG